MEKEEIIAEIMEEVEQAEEENEAEEAEILMEEIVTEE